MTPRDRALRSSVIATLLSAAITAPLANALAAPAPPPALAEAPPAETGAEPAADTLEDGKDQTIEAYLERLDLGVLHMEHLERRLNRVSRDERIEVAEKLGRAYVKMLERATTPEDAAPWEQRSRALLASVPEADSFELRLNLLRAIYLRGESVAERHRLRLDDQDQSAAAYTSLRAVAKEAREIAGRLNARVQHLERIEAQQDSTAALGKELGESRRLRSIAYYYAGWASVYAAELGREDPGNLAYEAARDFGWLLNAPGRPASIEQATAEMFRFEHVARAAIGSAMAASLRGNDVEAVRWIELIGESPELPDVVRDQLIARRMGVYAAAKRWADLERVVRIRKRVLVSGQPDQIVPLPAVLARYLAVLALEADRRVAGPQIEDLARLAIGDLVAQKQADQVLDLVARYGTAPLGDRGFIVHYVRGLHQFEQARAQVAPPAGASATASPDDAPAPRSPEVINAFRSAADLLEAALAQDDAAAFGPERVRAMITLGRARLEAGDLDVAVDRFTAAADLVERPAPASAGAAAPPTDLLAAQGEEALWLAVSTLDRQIREQGRSDARVEKRNQLITRYLRLHGESERASRIALLQAGEPGALDEEEAIRVLSAVGRDDPVYESARRQLARALYNAFRAAKPDQRDFAAGRYIAVAEEILGWDVRAATTDSGTDAKAAAERSLARARQIIDALLATRQPDADRAESLVRTITAVAPIAVADQNQLALELSTYRVLIALARGEIGPAADLADTLAQSNDLGGKHGEHADRAVYRALFRQVAAPPGADGALDPSDRDQRLVRVGSRLIARLGAEAGARSASAPRDTLALHDQVAAAAFRVWQSGGDTAMRDLVQKLDGIVLAAQPLAGSALKRSAAVYESLGDTARALETWGTIAGASPSGSETWFEARFNAVRILAQTDSPRALELLSQQRALFPDLGPEPWGKRFRDIEAQLTGAPSAPTQGGAP